jgi:hypothetical protein
MNSIRSKYCNAKTAAAVKAGPGVAADLALRCERYRVTEKAREQEQA